MGGMGAGGPDGVGVVGTGGPDGREGGCRRGMAVSQIGVGVGGVGWGRRTRLGGCGRARESDSREGGCRSGW